MTDTVFKRKYTSTNSYKDRKRKLESVDKSEDVNNSTISAEEPLSKTTSQSRIKSTMQLRTASIVEEDHDVVQHSSEHQDDNNATDKPINNDDIPAATKTQSANSKRTYARVRSYRNDAPSSKWMDEPLREDYSELRKKWGVDESDEEEVYAPTHKSFSHLRSMGVNRRFDEELDYICDGFLGTSSNIRRSSALSVSQKLINQDWKKWLLDSEECLDKLWKGLTQYSSTGDAIFDAVASIIIAHLSQTTSISPINSLSPSFCSTIGKLYQSNNSSDAFRMNEKFLSRSERPLLREVRKVAQEVLHNSEITIPNFLVFALGGIGGYTSLVDYSDVVDVAIDVFNRTQVVDKQLDHIMNLMKVIETSSDVADREVFKKLSLVFGLLADQENCKEEYLKTTTKAMVTLSVTRKNTIRETFVTKRVAIDALTHLSQRQSDNNLDLVCLLLGLVMNLLELGGDNVKDVYQAISEDSTISLIFNVNYAELNASDTTELNEMSSKVVSCTLSACILSHCIVGIPSFADKLKDQIKLDDMIKLLKLNLIVDESDKATKLIETVENLVNNNK